MAIPSRVKGKGKAREKKRQSAQPVLTASLSDVRPFATLLRAVAFANRATMRINPTGLMINVEDSKTLLGSSIIGTPIFEEFIYHYQSQREIRNLMNMNMKSKAKSKSKSKSKRKRSTRAQNSDADGEEVDELMSSDDSEEEHDELDGEEMDEDNDMNEGEEEYEGDETIIEFQLNVLLECLNIFGTASGSGGMTAGLGGPRADGAGAGGEGRRRWSGGGGQQRRDEEESGTESEDGGDGDGEGVRRRNHNGRSSRKGKGKGRDDGNGRIENYFGEHKGTGMRLSYAGFGEPLVLLLAEDENGPTTRCELQTYQEEEGLELPFDTERTVLWTMFKSSWLRDALSELEPLCEKITFVGSPGSKSSNNVAPNSRRMNTNTTSTSAAGTSASGRRAKKGRDPLLRIQATGTFGSVQMDYPQDREVIEYFECNRTVSFSYKVAHIMKTMRALQSSMRTSLRIDDEGLLSLQFAIYSPRPGGGKPIQSVVEFKCLPLNDDA